MEHFTVTWICWIVVDDGARMCCARVTPARYEAWRTTRDPLDSSAALVRCFAVQGVACSDFYKATTKIILYKFSLSFFINQMEIFAR